MSKVGFQGERGAYSEIACLKYFGSNIEPRGYKTFGEVFKAVKDAEVDYGVLPLENSTTGSISENYDFLLKYSFYIVGEIFLKIKHCLMTFNSKLKLKDIKRVYSHPQALDQCRKFLEENKLEPVSTFDTAGSVKIIKKNGDKEDGAIIASELVSKIYNLKILKKNIGPRMNITRFIVISKNEYLKSKEREMKTSVVFKTKHKPGALVNSLLGFKENRINLTKIESRPIKNRPWEYFFYLDFEGSRNDETVKRALQKLKEHSSFLKIIGSYPTG